MPDTVPLGDQALLRYCSDESAALQFAAQVRHWSPPWLVDVVQAYTSVAVFFDGEQIDFAGAAKLLEEPHTAPDADLASCGQLHFIPCCYELGPDLERVAEHTRLSVAEVIRLHAASEYRVYAIGFCPGFPYLGYLPAELAGVPRLPTPRLQVEPGSIGLTGRQTGIYPEARPGGWNLIGRTPLQLVSVADDYFPLRVGDRVQFEPINAEKFQQLLGQRLE